MERQPDDVLTALAGSWRLSREVRHADGMLVWASGFAVLEERDGGLTEREWGRARFPDGASARFEQRRRWRGEGCALVIEKGDGSPLCTVRDGTGRHDCPPDTYRLRLETGELPSAWTMEWTVTGPHKDYAMRTRYAR